MSTSSVSTLVILYVVAYMYSMQIAPWVQRRFPQSSMNKTHEQCVAQPAGTPKWMLSGRGKSYIIGGHSASNKLGDCLVTFWGGTHFALYLAIGFFCPEHGIVANVAGVIFEVYEWKVYDCADPLDVLLNVAGFIAGRALGTIMNANPSSRASKLST